MPEGCGLRYPLRVHEMIRRGDELTEIVSDSHELGSRVGDPKNTAHGVIPGVMPEQSSTPTHFRNRPERRIRCNARDTEETRWAPHHANRIITGFISIFEQ